MVRPLLLLCVMLLPAVCRAVVYSPADSIRVEAMLRRGASLAEDSSLMLHYARQLVGVPYVAHTLESEDGKERLVVNMSQMDCTTLVETVTALALTTWHGSTKWADFCRWLTAIRYIDGVRDGYASRCHYFTQWVASAQARGLVREVQGDDEADHFPFVSTQHVRLHHMTHHRDQYPVIKTDAGEASRVAKRERQYSGVRVRYIPTRMLGRRRSELSCIHDGDILAMVSKKDGLDVAHLGIAVWDKDGKLHLLNASSLHRRVVLDSQSLSTYMTKQPHMQGIRVVRVLRPDSRTKSCQSLAPSRPPREDEPKPLPTLPERRNLITS